MWFSSFHRVGERMFPSARQHSRRSGSPQKKRGKTFLYLEQLEDRSVPSQFSLVSLSGACGYSCSGTTSVFDYVQDKVVTVPEQESQTFTASTSNPTAGGSFDVNYPFPGPVWGSAGANVGGFTGVIPSTGAQVAEFTGLAYLDIYQNPLGPTSFNGNAWANGTASFLITPGDGEKIGDPVYVLAQVDDNAFPSPPGGTTTATLTMTTPTGTLIQTPPNGSSQILGYIGDTVGASFSTNVDLSGSAGPQEIGASAVVAVQWYLAPAPLPGQPTITTTASEQGNVVGGAVLSDTASLTGGYNPTGTIAFTQT